MHACLWTQKDTSSPVPHTPLAPIYLIRVPHHTDAPKGGYVPLPLSLGPTVAACWADGMNGAVAALTQQADQGVLRGVDVLELICARGDHGCQETSEERRHTARTAWRVGVVPWLPKQ